MKQSKSKRTAFELIAQKLPTILAWVNLGYLLAILVSSILTYREINFLNRTASESARIAITRTIADASASRLITKDYAGLETLIMRAMAEPSIISVAIVGIDGRPLTFLQRSPGEQDPKLVFTTQKFQFPKDHEKTHVDRDLKGNLTVWHPIESGTEIGWVVALYSNESSEKISDSMLLNVIITAGVAGSFLVILSTLYFLNKLIRLRSDNEALLELEKQSSQEVINSHIAMMEALGSAIAKRDSDTAEHNYRVTWIAIELGEKLAIHEREMQKLVVGSFLHDIGKVGIPDAILLKPGSLSEDEMAIMRTHVQHGVDMVREAGWLMDALDVVSCHHEKWDGSGYPKKLSGNDIPFSARIFSVADVFDALSSRRPYKEPLSFEQTMKIMEAGSNAHFDPMILQTFIEIAPALHQKLSEADETQVVRLVTKKIRKYFYHQEIEA